MLVYLKTTDGSVNTEVGFPGLVEHPATLKNGSIVFYYVECNEPHPGWRAKISPDGTLTINKGNGDKDVREGLTFLGSGSPRGPWKPVF